MGAEAQVLDAEVVEDDVDAPKGVVRTVHREKVGGLLKPVAEPQEVLEAQEGVRSLVEKALQEDRDFGVIPGTSKPTLLKPGAERINAAFGVAPRYRIVEREIDHDREVNWRKRKKRWENGNFAGWDEETGLSHGLYRYVVECELIHRESGAPVGQGIGSCSTMESKYIDRPRDMENTVIKMGAKRALIAATLNAYGLSDQFTQDIEDNPEAYGAGGGSRDPATLDSICPFKKHKGEPWGQVLDEDPEYVDWILENIDDLDTDLRELLEGARNGGDEDEEGLGEEATEKVKARYFALLAELFAVPRIREQARKTYQKADPKVPDSCTEWSGLHYSRAVGKVENRGRDLFIGAATSLKEKDPASESIQGQVKELIDKCDLSAEEAGAAWEVLDTGYRPLVKALRDHLDVTRTKKMQGHEDPEPEPEEEEEADEEPGEEPVAAGDIEDVDDELPF